MNSIAVSDYCSANEGTISLVVTWVLLSIGILVVSLRLYVRFGPRYNIGWDDYAAVAGLIIGIITAGIFTKTIASGLGRHTSCLPQEANKYVLEFSAIVEGLNFLGIGVVKISVCLTLLRVVEVARPKTARFLWCLLTFVAITHLALAIIYVLRCRPLTAEWGPQMRASCLPTHTINLAGYLSFAADVVTDLICATIPILLVQRLQMDIRTKLALCGLMSLGIFTAGCAVAKAISLKSVTADDYTWGLNIVAIWAVVEQFLGIIITSIPMLRPLFSSSNKSFHSWSLIRSNTRRYFSWKNKHSGLNSPRCSQSERQQTHGSDSNLRDVKKNPISPVVCQGHGQVDGNYCADLSYSVVLDKGCAKKSIGDDFEGNRGIAFLSAWSAPNIFDRRPAVISMPATLA